LVALEHHHQDVEGEANEDEEEEEQTHDHDDRGMEVEVEDVEYHDHVHQEEGYNASESSIGSSMDNISLSIGNSLNLFNALLPSPSSSSSTYITFF